MQWHGFFYLASVIYQIKQNHWCLYNWKQQLKFTNWISEFCSKIHYGLWQGNNNQREVEGNGESMASWKQSHTLCPSFQQKIFIKLMPSPQLISQHSRRHLDGEIIEDSWYTWIYVYLFIYINVYVCVHVGGGWTRSDQMKDYIMLHSLLQHSSCRWMDFLTPSIYLICFFMPSALRWLCSLQDYKHQGRWLYGKTCGFKVWEKRPEMLWTTRLFTF